MKKFLLSINSNDCNAIFDIHWSIIQIWKCKNFYVHS